MAHLDSNLGSFSNEDLLKIGDEIWNLSYRHTNDDFEAIQALLDHTDTLEEPLAITMKAALLIPNEQLIVLWAARWRDQNAPRLVFDEKYAALLMATDVGSEALQLLIPPWKAFLIQIPDNLLTTYCSLSNKEVSIPRIFVQVMKTSEGEDAWCFVAQGSSGVQLWRHGLTPHQLINVNKKNVEGIWEGSNFLSPLQDKDERVLLLIGRLIASACFAMSNPENYHRQKLNKGRGQKWKLNKSLPEIQNYIMGRKLTIDCRSAIRDYLNGHRNNTPKLRTLVRGHWKHQPCGTKFQLRKLLHIEPYWRGTEEANVLGREIHIKL